MRCAGLHCPGCGDGAGNVGLAGAALIAAEVILNAIWEIIAVTAASAVLSFAAVFLIARATARREAAFGARLAAMHEREALAVTVTPQVAQGTRPPAVEQHVHFHFDPADREAAAIIRQALPGQAGDVSH